MTAPFVLLLIAVILWFIAALPWPFTNPSPIQLGWLGLFFYGLSLLVK